MAGFFSSLSVVFSTTFFVTFSVASFFSIVVAFGLILSLRFISSTTAFGFAIGGTTTVVVTGFSTFFVGLSDAFASHPSACKSAFTLSPIFLFLVSNKITFALTTCHSFTISLGFWMDLCDNSDK